MIDVIALCQTLIRFPSVTPESAGSLEYLEALLKEKGFETHLLEFGEGEEHSTVKNLYARYGKKSPHLMFLGHVDVVPPGEIDLWKFPPFEGVIHEEFLYGRGAVDMKGAIACFVDAVSKNLESITGSISLLLTADEEGPAINGTKKVLKWLEQKNQLPDFCLVGEPTNPSEVEKMIKIGRRGSLHGYVRSEGIQGHVAYPQKAKNPIPSLLGFLQALIHQPLDKGTAEFDPSTLQITTIDCGNKTTNVIPQKVEAHFNIRFNSLHSIESLTAWIKKTAEAFCVQVDVIPSSTPFFTPPGSGHSLLQENIRKVTGKETIFSTAGGTSDARFVDSYCPVMEFGLTNETMHKINERVHIEELISLTKIYEEFIKGFFKLNIDHHLS